MNGLNFKSFILQLPIYLDGKIRKEVHFHVLHKRFIINKKQLLKNQCRTAKKIQDRLQAIIQMQFPGRWH